MRNFLKLGLWAIALILFFNAFAVVETKAQALNEILNRMENNRKSLNSLSSSITMDKYNEQIDHHEVQIGTVNYVSGKNEKDMYVRLNWDKPVIEQIAVVKDKYKLYRPDLKQVIIGKVDKATGGAKANGALAFLSMSRAQLKANYAVKYIGEEKIEGGVGTIHIQLTPKTAMNYKSADLWVDSDGMPRQARIVEKNDDTTTILLYDIRKNAKFDGSIFDIKYPKDTKEIKG